MSTVPMLRNIEDQPASHLGVLALQQNSQHSLLTACAEAIRKAKGNVIFSGMGGSLFATYAAVSRLQSAGYNVQLVESAELLHYGSAMLRAKDVGVIISRSGGSIEPVRLAEKMRDAGMTVIAVTNVPESRLEEIADLTLHIGAQADMLIAIQTYTGTVLTLSLLAEAVVTGSTTELSDECSATLSDLSAHIARCLQASDEWHGLLTDGPLYLLGRGPALGTVYEGQLLLHETAKTAAVGMSCGQFRHGPAEILSGKFSAVVFGTAEVTRALDRSLANDLHAAGANVRWIGPEERNGAPSMVAWHHVAAALAPLYDIVPIQVAAYRLALWRGVTPGEFRFVTEVTAAESGFLPSAHA